MVTLSIEGIGSSELAYQLSKPVITVGASSQNDVVIRAPGVAPRHIVIQYKDGLYTFVGQNRQVVVLNGERRSRGVLRLGDRIRIGTATLVVKEISHEVAVEAPAAAGVTGSRPSSPPAAAAPRPRAEVVLYSEPTRLAEGRRHMVEAFRAGVRADLIPALRTLFESFFGTRQALLATVEPDGRFRPVVSHWTSELPRLPPRTFEELAQTGRFGLLALGPRQILIFPVPAGPLQSVAYLVVETDGDSRADDEAILGELARMLAVNWDRVERLSAFYGPWESGARSRTEDQLPGTSQAIRVLRERVVEAARTFDPLLICGRPGSGRTFVAALVASLNPSRSLSMQTFQARVDDEAAQRVELFGSSDGDAGSLIQRARGGALVFRDAHLLSPALQRETAAAIRRDLESAYGPSIRWIATTGQDCMGLLSEGAIDSTLFNLFHHHILRLPSLTERREDLPLLMVRMMETVAEEQHKEIRGIELETLNSLLKHAFDGEMTELIAELRRLVSATPDGEMVRGLVPVGGSRVGAEGADEVEVAGAALLSQDDLKAVVPAVERLIIDRVLRRTMGNQSKAARVLNLSRGALIAKMKEYDLADYRYLRRSR